MMVIDDEHVQTIDESVHYREEMVNHSVQTESAGTLLQSMVIHVETFFADALRSQHCILVHEIVQDLLKISRIKRKIINAK